MTRRTILRLRAPGQRVARRPTPLPTQGAVDTALNAFVTAAEARDTRQMRSALGVVEVATEQQVQCAMLHVQRARRISREALLGVLAG